MLPADSSFQRFLAFLRGDPGGGAFARIRFYGFRLIMGGIIGFFVVAMATPSRDHRGEGFSLDIYLAGIACGAVLMLAFAIVPRLLRPKDWPTHEEFRRGPDARNDERR
jgi:hypothetical protein